MARGPFSVDPNSVADISPVQIQSERTASAAPARQAEQQAAVAGQRATLTAIEGVADLAANAGAIIVDRSKKEAAANLKEQLKSVKDALQVTRFPSLEKQYFSKEAQNNPYFQGVLDEFNRIKAAGRTGRLPSEFVVERLESLVSTAKTKVPAFSQELDAAARDVLGFDPETKFLSDLLRDTPQEQAQQQLEARASRVGLTSAQLQNIELATTQMSFEQQRLNLLKQQGTYGAAQLAKQTRQATALTYVAVMAQIGDAQASGQGLTDESLKQLIQGQFSAQRASLLNEMPGTIDPSTVNGHLSTLDTEEKRMIKLAEDGSLLRMLEQQKELLVTSAEVDLLTTPVLGKVYATLGPGPGAEVMTTIARFKDNPEALSAALSIGADGVAPLSLGLVLEGADGALDVLSGVREAGSDAEQRVASWFAAKTLQSGNIVNAEGEVVKVEAQEAVRLVDVLTGAGEDISVAALSEPRIVKTVTATKEVHGQTLNVMQAYQATLANEYAQLRASGELPLSEITVQDGIIMDNSLGARAVSDKFFGAGPNDPANVASPAYSEWVKKANRLIDMAEKYKLSGIVPATIYSNPEALLKVLTTGVTQQEQPVETKNQNVTWGVDENGLPVRITE
jgi:hypothetical protein